MVDMKLSFDPMTIEHLGFKMYSHLPNAVAELVANAYDADAEHVTVVVNDEPRSVEVRDDGHGMSAEDLAEKYLRIGRNRRVDDSGASESGRRRVAGKKGLGKLALFGIGKRVTVRTKRRGTDAWTVVTMDWDEIKAATGGEYRPDTGTEPGAQGEHGTVIVVEQLQRRTPIIPVALAGSLARLFNYTDNGFSISVVHDGDEPIEVDRDLRYSGIGIETDWRVPDDVPEVAGAAPAPAITGVLFASVKPLPQEMRGVTIYVNGRLANEPEYFGVPESSHAYSYLTGYIDADYLDDLEDDVIATDRRSVSWESEQSRALREYLEAVLREVAKKRRDTRKGAKRDRLRKELGVDPQAWAGTIQGPEGRSLGDVLEVLVSPSSEISDEDRDAIVVGLLEIAPEYADMHWRRLHPSIQAASGDLYKTGQYFLAVLEAIKQYVHDVRSASGVSHGPDLDALQMAFGSNRQLDVFAPYLGDGLPDETAENIRECQRSISVGVWKGFRNPLAHHQVSVLETTGVFTYQDCLDGLGIISHLRRRLDGAQQAGPGVA